MTRWNRIVAACALVAACGGRPAEEVPGDEPDFPPLPRDVNVEVLNGSGVNGAARAAAFRLRRAGLDVVWYGGADDAWKDRERTAVVVRRRDTTGVGRIRELYPRAELIDRYDESREVDLTVVVGRDIREAPLER